MRVKEESGQAILRQNIKKQLRSSHLGSMANTRGKGGSGDKSPLLGLQNHCRWWLHPWNQKTVASWQESSDKPR